jgi:hypothetical protein
VELEVRPKYLVADTNCYIDHLNALVRLAREKHYTIVAPLVGKFSQNIVLQPWEGQPLSIRPGNAIADRSDKKMKMALSFSCQISTLILQIKVKKKGGSRGRRDRESESQVKKEKGQTFPGGD